MVSKIKWKYYSEKPFSVAYRFARADKRDQTVQYNAPQFNNGDSINTSEFPCNTGLHEYDRSVGRGLPHETILLEHARNISNTPYRSSNNV